MNPSVRSILRRHDLPATPRGEPAVQVRAAALLELRRRRARAAPPIIAPNPSVYEAEEHRRALHAFGLAHDLGDLEDGLARRRSPDAIEEQQAMEVGRCRDDALYWLDHYAWMPLPKAGPGEPRQVPLILWPRQRELVAWVVQSIREGRDGIVGKGREVGATWMFLDVFLWCWLFEDGFLSKLFSRKEKYVDDGTRDSLFGMLRWQLAQQPDYLRPTEYVDTALRLINGDNGSEIIGEATTPEAGRGGRRTAVLFDEFSRVEDRIQTEAWLSLHTVARSRFAVSTPNGRGNHFYTLWGLLPEEQRFVADWRTNPDRTDEWFEGLLMESGGDMTWDQRAQEHEVSFAGVSGLRILHAPPSALYDDRDLDADARSSWPVMAMMDFGSGPSYSAFTVFLLDFKPDQAIAHSWVDLALIWQGEPAQVIAADIRAALDQYGGMKWIYGDPAGWARESDQESWGTRLNACGIGIQQLPAWYNDPFGIKSTLDELDEMLRSGLMRVHRERAAIFWEAVEGWQWKVPEGVPVSMIKNLESVKPSKDRYSHPGDTGRYGAGALKRILTRSRVVRKHVPRTGRKPLAASRGRRVAEAFVKMGPRLR